MIVNRLVINIFNRKYDLWIHYNYDIFGDDSSYIKKIENSIENYEIENIYLGSGFSGDFKVINCVVNGEIRQQIKNQAFIEPEYINCLISEHMK